MRLVKLRPGVAMFVFCASVVMAQNRPLSPRGQASTQVGGSYNSEGQYSGGKWIDIDYGRPILRGRTDMFGEGANYSTKIYAGAPIWRIGADVTTRIKTEAAQRLTVSVLSQNGYGRSLSVLIIRRPL